MIAKIETKQATETSCYVDASVEDFLIRVEFVKGGGVWFGRPEEVAKHDLTNPGTIHFADAVEAHEHFTGLNDKKAALIVGVANLLVDDYFKI